MLKELVWPCTTRLIWVELNIYYMLDPKSKEVLETHSFYDYSGMVVQDDYRVPHIPEVVAKSGHALLYFYSDAAYNLTGFSISYR